MLKKEKEKANKNMYYSVSRETDPVEYLDKEIYKDTSHMTLASVKSHNLSSAHGKP